MWRCQGVLTVGVGGWVRGKWVWVRSVKNVELNFVTVLRLIVTVLRLNCAYFATRLCEFATRADPNLWIYDSNCDSITTQLRLNFARATRLRLVCDSVCDWILTRDSVCDWIYDSNFAARLNYDSIATQLRLSYDSNLGARQNCDKFTSHSDSIATFQTRLNLAQILAPARLTLFRQQMHHFAIASFTSL